LECTHTHIHIFIYHRDNILHNIYAWQGAAPFNKAIGSYVQDAGSGTGHNHAHTLSGTLTGTVTTSISGSVTASGTNTFSPYVVVNYIIRF